MGMTHEVTQHSIVSSLSFKIKNSSQKTKTGKSHNKKKEVMTCKGKKNERKKGSGQALPLLAPVSDCYSTVPQHSSSVLPRCLSWPSVVTVHFDSCKFSQISIRQSLMFWFRLKKKFPLCFSVETEYPYSPQKTTTQWKIFYFLS